MLAAKKNAAADRNGMIEWTTPMLRNLPGVRRASLNRGLIDSSAASVTSLQHSPPLRLVLVMMTTLIEHEHCVGKCGAAQHRWRLNATGHQR